MKRLTLVLAMLATVSVTAGDAVDPYAGPAPMVVWVQTDPWAMVIGADTPRLVIYEGGRAIFRDLTDKRRYLYRTVVLNPDVLKSVMDHVASLGDFSATKSHYDLAPNVTDQPTTLLYVNAGPIRLSTSVYGLFTNSTPLPAYTVAPSHHDADALPPSIRSLYQYLAALQFDGAVAWVPERVEVMIWPYDYAPQKSIHWPTGWPGLEAPDTKSWGEDSYSIYLPGELLGELEKFLRTRKPKGAVEIGGKKWAVGHRYVFPGETIWLDVFGVTDDSHE